MRVKLLLTVFLSLGISSFAQNGWKVCNTPSTSSRIDDLFMVNKKTGYAVCGGQIMKTSDEGENWINLVQDNSVYCRSVEFINMQKGFVGGFPNFANNINILRRTTDGGATWTDLTPLLHHKARKGICGLAAADSNTIYGGGNWYQDSGYIVKSADGGNSWSFIDMSAYASSIIDLNFTSKDTGFAVGKSMLPVEGAVILYTTNGGASWTIPYNGGARQNEYCWKIQRLTPRIYFASLQTLSNYSSKVLRSIDGGMNWKELEVSAVNYDLQGVGFIDPNHGWTGGWGRTTFETKDGGKTWDSIPVCPLMNRVFRVNDTTMFATGNQIWKYKGTSLYPAIPPTSLVSMKCHPNPVKDLLTVNIAIAVNTHVSILLLDETGKRIKIIDNTDRPKGSYQFYVNTIQLPEAMYYVVLMTHEDKLVAKVWVTR